MRHYSRIQQEILEKRAAKTREYVRRVMKRVERSAHPILAASPRPTDPVQQLPAFHTED